MSAQPKQSQWKKTGDHVAIDLASSIASRRATMTPVGIQIGDNYDQELLRRVIAVSTRSHRRNGMYFVGRDGLCSARH